MAYASVEILTPKLQQLIDQSNKNVSMIATELGVAQGTIWRWLKEPHSTGVNPRVFHRMLEVFKVTADELKANGSLSDTDKSTETLLQRLIREGKIMPGEVIAEAASMSEKGRAAVERKHKKGKG